MTHDTWSSNDAGKNGNKQYLQLVISASYDLLDKSRQEIIDLCLKELRQALPAVREAQLVKATVIKEMAATFSPEPGCDLPCACYIRRKPGHSFPRRTPLPVNGGRRGQWLVLQPQAECRNTDRCSDRA